MSSVWIMSRKLENSQTVLSRFMKIEMNFGFMDNSYCYKGLWFWPRDTSEQAIDCNPLHAPTRTFSPFFSLLFIICLFFSHFIYFSLFFSLPEPSSSRIPLPNLSPSRASYVRAPLNKFIVLNFAWYNIGSHIGRKWICERNEMSRMMSFA